MKNIKAVLQSSIKDCGVSCMSWIIKYFDGYVPLEKLREETYTDNTGTNAYHIVNAFKKFGFDSKGIFEKDILSNNLYYPLIAHLKLENGLEHFVVVKKIHNNTIYLMDPGIGYVKLSINKFNKLFTGNVILVYPRNNIVKMNKGITINDIFFKIINKEKFLIIKIIVSSILWTILVIISSYYLKICGNILTKDNSLLKYFIIGFGIVMILKVLFLYIKNYYINHLSNLVDTYIYPEFIYHLFSLSLKSIKNRTTGEIMTRIDELGSIKSLFSDILCSSFLDSIMILISILVLYIINSKLFICLLIFVLIYILYGIIISKIVYKKVLENINYQTDFNSVIQERIKMFESIKNLNIKANILDDIESYLSKLLFNNYKFNDFFNKTNLIKDFIIELSVFIINGYGFYLIKNNYLTLIDLFTFNIIISYFIDPIKNIISMLPKYNFIKATFSKIQEFINIDEEKYSESKELLKNSIEFKNVSYSYNNYDNTLNNCSFKISGSDHVLLNGPSGIGKSTICKLIYKEDTVNKGSILIDDININDLSLSTIRNNILYVSQNEELFSGSVKENILAYRNISKEKFRDVCKLCYVDEIIEKRKLRYDSFIEPMVNLSGGERERIILARGLLKDANIIILDEALSQVDIKLEEKIIKNIKLYFKDKMIIYISHKNQKRSFNKILEIGEINGIL